MKKRLFCAVLQVVAVGSIGLIVESARGGGDTVTCQIVHFTGDWVIWGSQRLKFSCAFACS